jgi:D-alanyl-D-alanine carboxypeptidase
MPTATATPHAPAGPSDPIQPLLVKTITFRTAPVQTASLAPMPALVPVASPSPPPSAPPAVHTQPAAQLPDAPHTIVVASSEPGAIATSSKSEPIRNEPAKAEPAKAEVAKAEVAKAEVAKAEVVKTEIAKAEIAKPEPAKPEPAAPPAHAHGGWLIQIGAFEGEDEAREHLSDAQIKARAMLAAADPFTERVQKGDKALYRARFAGFDKQTAEAACRQLKRSDIDCMALKN